MKGVARPEQWIRSACACSQQKCVLFQNGVLFSETLRLTRASPHTRNLQYHLFPVSSSLLFKNIGSVSLQSSVTAHKTITTMQPCDYTSYVYNNAHPVGVYLVA